MGEEVTPYIVALGVFLVAYPFPQIASGVLQENARWAPIAVPMFAAGASLIALGAML